MCATGKKVRQVFSLLVYQQSRFVTRANRATARGAKNEIAKKGGAEKMRGAPKAR